MGRRLELSAKLHAILGTQNVYFQPPSDTAMEYPCFVYHLEELDVKYADNGVYLILDKYCVKYITDDPDDNKAAEMLSEFKHCKFDRPYVADNLHHFVYNLYY